MNKLESNRSCNTAKASIVDGSAVLWVLDWPDDSPTEAIVSNLYHRVLEMLFYQDVYFVFDRYEDFSIKGFTHADRAKNIAYHRHKTTLTSILPSKVKVLQCTSKKTQLIDIIVSYLVEKVSEAKLNHTFVVTGSDDTPVQVKKGQIMNRHDLTTTHEEDDVIIVQRCYHLAK